MGMIELFAHKADVFVPVHGTVANADVYFKEKVDPIISELKAENTELKQKLEDAKASAYAESVDAGMENRRLKRALWLARAARARSMKTCEELDNYVRNHLNRNSRWDYISSQRDDCWFYAWDKCEQKCLKKAKEYK
jgi:hypothetical protein